MPCSSVPGDRSGTAQEEKLSRSAYPHRFQGQERVPEQSADAGKDTHDLIPGGPPRSPSSEPAPHRGEGPGPLAAAASGAIHAKQRRGPGEATAVQQVADGLVGRKILARLVAPAEVAVSLASSSGELTGRPNRLLSSSSSRAGSKVTKPGVIARVCSRTASIRGRVSTATASTGRSSDSVSERSLRRCRRNPNPCVPRSRTLRGDLLAGVEVRAGRSRSRSRPVRRRSPK